MVSKSRAMLRGLVAEHRQDLETVSLQQLGPAHHQQFIDKPKLARSNRPPATKGHKQS